MHAAMRLADGHLLAAPAGEQGGVVTMIVIMVVLMLLPLVALLMLVLKCYKRCPSNRILVVYGKTGQGPQGTTAKTIRGGGVFVVPLIQDCAWLSLEPIEVAISQRKDVAGANLGFKIPRSFTVAIGTTAELMHNAAVRLLGLDTQQIQQQAHAVIVAELGKWVDSFEAAGDTADSETFFSKLDAMLATALKPMGLVLIGYRRE